MIAGIQHKVSNFIQEKNLLHSNENVIVALSGGSDSVALLRLMDSLGYKCIAAHCNFHLRGAESDRDMNFVKNLCDTNHIPLEIIHFDTKEYAEDNHISIEMAARELRYNWFENLSLQHKIDKIAIAHHSDDVIETFFINLMRGASIHGLTGIRERNNKIIRPLLCLSRKDILDYLRELDQTYVTDSTNNDTEFVRNKIRNILIPQIEDIKPTFRKVMQRNLDMLRQTEEFVNQNIDEIKETITKSEGNTTFIDTLLLKKSHSKQYCFILGEILKNYGFTRVTCEEITKMSEIESGKKFLSQTHILVKNRNILEISSIDTLNKKEYNYFINDGVSKITEPVALKISYQDINNTVIKKDKNICYIDYDKVQFPMEIKHWETGDYFIPFGMNGRKKISDFFVSEKMSILQKDNQWILKSDNNVVWIIGRRADNRFRITDSTKRIMILELI